MPVKASIDSNTCPSIRASRRMRSWVRRATAWGWSRCRGKQAHSSSALAKARAASTPNAARQPKPSEISTPMGMPNTVAATVPKATSETARPARAGPASSTAVALASDQNTGRARAGTKRASAMTQILGASAASRLEAPNSASTATNSRLRSILAINAVSSGLTAATVKANSVTSKPAWDTVTCRSRASGGNRPTIRNSVVRMVNPAVESKRMGNSMRFPVRTARARRAMSRTGKGVAAAWGRRRCVPPPSFTRGSRWVGGESNASTRYCSETRARDKEGRPGMTVQYFRTAAPPGDSAQVGRQQRFDGAPEFVGGVGAGLGRPGGDVLVLAQVTVGSGHGRHAGGVGRLDVAQVVAHVDAAVGGVAGLARGVQQRRGMRLGVFGGVAAHQHGAVARQAQELDDGQGQVGDLVGDDPPGQPARADAVEQGGDAREEPAVHGRAGCVVLQELLAGGFVIGMPGQQVERDAQQPARALRGDRAQG